MHSHAIFGVGRDLPSSTYRYSSQPSSTALQVPPEYSIQPPPQFLVLTCEVHSDSTNPMRRHCGRNLIDRCNHSSTLLGVG